MADRKIDVHTHFVPDFYREALLEKGIDHPDGMPGIPAWSPESHLDFMNVCMLYLTIQFDLPIFSNFEKKPTSLQAYKPTSLQAYKPTRSYDLLD